MTKQSKPLILLYVLVIAYAVAGCATLRGVQQLSPVQKVTLAQNTYAAAVDQLTDLRAAGKISDRDALRIEPVLIAADNALALARSRAVSGKGSVDDALTLVLRATVEIDTFVREHK